MIGSKRTLYEQLVNKDEHFTSLTLDPLCPGVGGELGGIFEIQSKLLLSKPPAEPIMATLTCYLLPNVANSVQTRRKVKWQQTMPCSYTTIPTGVKGAFLFDIPKSCIPSKRKPWAEYIWRISLQTDYAKSTYAGGVIGGWPVVVGDTADASGIPKSTDLTMQRSKTITVDPNYQSEEQKKTDRKGAIVVGAIFSVLGTILLFSSAYLLGVVFLVLGLAVIRAGWLNLR